jgi:hypothetical protein
MKAFKKKNAIDIKEAQELLEIFGSLDNETKELALATLTGMRLVSEAVSGAGKIEQVG